MAKKKEAMELTEKAMELTESDKSLLADIVKAAETNICLSIFPDKHPALLHNLFVEVNRGIKNEEGAVASRPTTAGRTYVAEMSMKDVTDSNRTFEQAEGIGAVIESTPASDLKPTGFVLVSNVPIPEAKRGGKGKADKWPFAQMEPGQSFFIPDTEEYEAAKKFASTVSSATAKYHEVIPGEFRERKRKVDGKIIVDTVPAERQTRQFIIRAALGDNWGFEGVKGAGVWRVK